MAWRADENSAMRDLGLLDLGQLTCFLIGRVGLVATSTLPQAERPPQGAL